MTAAMSWETAAPTGTIIPLTIVSNAGKAAAEVVDDIIPGPSTQKLTVGGAYVTKIYCNTP